MPLSPPWSERLVDAATLYISLVYDTFQEKYVLLARGLGGSVVFQDFGVASTVAGLETLREPCESGE